jgi:hypothetical protein
MLFAMCADAGMLISILVFFMILGVVLCGLAVLALLGIVKLIEARRGWTGAPSLSILSSPETIP